MQSMRPHPRERSHEQENMNVKDLAFVSFADGRCGIGYIDEVKNDVVFVIGLYMDMPSPWQPPKYPPISHRWEVSPEQVSRIQVMPNEAMLKRIAGANRNVEDERVLDEVENAKTEPAPPSKKKKKE